MVLMENPYITQASILLETCRQRGLTIGLAESCTGGLLAATLTEVPGSSDVLKWGVVTYANEAKQALLGVPADSLVTAGAVSAEVAKSMVKGVLGGKPEVTLAASITGVAGPGASERKPAGLVYIGIGLWLDKSQPALISATEFHFTPTSRQHVRWQTVATALDLLYQRAHLA